MMWIKHYNIPILLTLIRLFGSPLILPVLLVYLLPFNILWVNVLLVCIFLLFGITDFFDGYLARKYGLVTAIGAVLDPVADKFLLYATLVALLTAGKIYFYWVIFLIGREFFMMALRILALQHHFYIPVSYLAKVKTSAQIMLLAFLIFNPYQKLGIYGAPGWNVFEIVLLLGSTGLSLFTALQYYQFFVCQFNAKQLPMYKKFSEE